MKKSIYIIKNTVNGKIYIGSSASPKFRIKSHFSALKHGRHIIGDMQDDYCVYGKESFVSRVVCENAEPYMEVFMQMVLKTKNREHGYNYKDKAGTSLGAVALRYRGEPKWWSGYIGKLWMQKESPELYQKVNWDAERKINDIEQNMLE